MFKKLRKKIKRKVKKAGKGIKKFAKKATNTKGLKRTAKRATNLNGAKRFVKKMGEAVKDTVSAAKWVPLVPFRGTMRTSLKNHGIDNPPKKISKVARLFFSVVIQKRQGIDPVTAAAASGQKVDDDSMIKTILDFLLNLVRGREEGEEMDELDEDIVDGIEYDYEHMSDQDEEDYINNQNNLDMDLDMRIKDNPKEYAENKKKNSKGKSSALPLAAAAFGAYTIFR